MRHVIRLTAPAFFGVLIAICSGCTAPPPQDTNQQSTNANSSSLSVPNPTPSNTGSIKVSSQPAGAAVMLIEEDEGGAGFPKPRGSSPTTITGVEPGKYAVHLELPGYKSFQKSIEVKAGETVELTAKLKK
jgi:PEGA domain-containing protein